MSSCTSVVTLRVSLVPASTEAWVRLQQRLHYEFRQPQLLEMALTHRSRHGRENNERLEFLGDSIVNFLVAEVLYAQMPQAREGDLTRLRASLVKEPTLADLARELDLGAELMLGAGELRSGGYRRDSILADTLEAVLAAIYLDSQDMAVCRRCLLHWYGDRLHNMQPAMLQKDAKTRLQEWLQAKHRALPVYEVLATHGQAHEQEFEVQCCVQEPFCCSRGRGSSRRIAEQQAAELLYQQLRRCRT